MTDKQLIKYALKARENSYSPYSNYKVGSALLTKSGKVFLGTNVESCAYSPSNCSERSAFFSAISNGERDFEKIAIVGSSGDEYAYPCGICRQVMVELAPNIKIICAKSPDDYTIVTIKDLLPHPFTPDDVNAVK